MLSDKKQLILLGIQIISTGYILVSGPLFIQNIPFLLMQIFGILLILWSLLAIKLNKTEAGKLPPGYFLTTRGPYEIIRHPIYAGMLLTMAGFVQGYGSLARFLVFIILIIATLIRISFEENFLTQQQKIYAGYKSKTHKLIPYLY